MLKYQTKIEINRNSQVLKKIVMLLTRVKLLLLFIDYYSWNLSTVAYYLNFNLRYNIDSLKMNSLHWL